MSVAGILGTNGTILRQYLPSGIANPDLETVLADGNTSGANDMVLAQSLLMPTSGAPIIELDGVTGIIDCTTLRVNGPGPTNVIELAGNGEIACSALEAEGGSIIVRRNGSAGIGLVCAPLNETTGNSAFTLRNGTTSLNPVNYVFYNPSTSGSGFSAGQMQLRAEGTGYTNTIFEADPSGEDFIVGDSSVVGGAALQVNGPSGTARVYDPIYNPPPSTTIHPLAGATNAARLSTGVQGPFSFTPTVTGIYKMEFGWELGSGAPPGGGVGYGARPGTSVIIYDTSLPSTAALSVQSYKNTAPSVIGTTSNMDTAGFSIASDTFTLTSGVSYAFYFDIQGNNIELSTAGSPDGEWFFKIVFYG